MDNRRYMYEQRLFKIYFIFRKKSISTLFAENIFFDIMKY